MPGYVSCCRTVCSAYDSGAEGAEPTALHIQATSARWCQPHTGPSSHVIPTADAAQQRGARHEHLCRQCVQHRDGRRNREAGWVHLAGNVCCRGRKWVGGARVLTGQLAAGFSGLLLTGEGRSATRPTCTHPPAHLTLHPPPQPSTPTHPPAAGGQGSLTPADIAEAALLPWHCSANCVPQEIVLKGVLPQA